MKNFLSIVISVVTVFCCAAENINGLNGVFPEHIKCIAVLTPASAPNPKSVRKAIAMMEKAGLKVKVMPNTFVRNGNKGPTVEQRMADWNMAVNDPEVDMIIPTRGGKGAQDLVGLIDWQKVKERNLYLMGFSNITYITSAMEFHKAGKPIAGPNVGRLASATQGAKKHLKAVLAKKDIPPFKLTALRKGDASGRIYAGHLGMLQGNHASKFKVVPDNRVIFIECVNRDTATYDKLFGKLLKKGYFDKVKAVVFCHFNRMKDPQNMDALLEKWASQLKCPVYKGYPYGHKDDNYALDFSITANIKDDTLYFECGK
ncbi:MAG: LD-carboxypeptidase [Lentisphaeria bacterium]|nr:LD-carboxypeptidase [Lentisphaeria bacterium]